MHIVLQSLGQTKLIVLPVHRKEHECEFLVSCLSYLFIIVCGLLCSEEMVNLLKSAEVRSSPANSFIMPSGVTRIESIQSSPNDSQRLTYE